MHRENLELLDDSLGIKILIQDYKAYGVEFIRDGKKFKATASREVVISGGSINSPQMLILSGIGPKEHLNELDISVIQDLPVGKNLYDHQIYMAYLLSHGLLTVASAFTVDGYESLKKKDFVQMTEENWQAISKPLAGKYMLGVFPILLHPKSKGTIKLKTKDLLDFSLLDSNCYSDNNSEDMKEMLSAIKDVFRISKTPAFQSIDSKYVSDPLPACSKYKHLSDNYWRCALKQLTYPSLHPVGTCKMGPKSDKTAIVDNKLKVHGISELRVADASIIPVTLAAHTTAASYMVGEKASDLIRKEH
ncbi:hypothetical protein ILUMI_17963 [Ignelater luminosus]|uniref:Glucose-methanol-choline oxidoreductase N-terminal domain-containing protein n=1 Tax=Ignelater luminosus TaxID=2038154 RepID=A0A8K0G6V0_IGNLU|nr:hypothetical protein ILUMI_17963 [Ignelater luminosus]